MAEISSTTPSMGNVRVMCHVCHVVNQPRPQGLLAAEAGKREDPGIISRAFCSNPYNFPSLYMEGLIFGILRYTAEHLQVV